MLLHVSVVHSSLLLCSNPLYEHVTMHVTLHASAEGHVGSIQVGAFFGIQIFCHF